MASDRSFHACKAYTSYMCNPYAIFAIHCIDFFCLSNSKLDRIS